MIIETQELSFRFQKGKDLLDKVSLHVPEGSIYGFLGPNGAGKSTTIRLITGLLAEQHPGQILLFRKPLTQQIPDVFSHLGCIIETPTLYLHLTGMQHLHYITKLQQKQSVDFDGLLQLVGLEHAKNIKVKKYSLGMKQRLSIAMTLINDPKLLILDEPVNGLDPQGIIEMRLLLQKLNKEKGITIFISSHILAEAEKLCTHVGILHQGRLQFEGTMSELRALNSQSTVTIQLKNTNDHFDFIRKLYPETTQISDTQLRIGLSSIEEIPLLVKFLTENNISIYQLQQTGGLEEWFMELTHQVKPI
ncbi:MAG TPA: ABC transporter ATP-binding protein [Flavobacterium sp.]|jgi:ABC-type multidrug transport system ATPase subunit|nr:ABC transporter ATP-binding protein [Flavobacterium sp.]